MKDEQIRQAFEAWYRLQSVNVREDLDPWSAWEGYQQALRTMTQEAKPLSGESRVAAVIGMQSAWVKAIPSHIEVTLHHAAMSAALTYLESHYTLTPKGGA